MRWPLIKVIFLTLTLWFLWTDVEGQKDQAYRDSILTLVQYRTFQYFYEGAEPNSGMARERFHMDGIYPDDDFHIVTTGGTGFGLMAIIVGMERGFISKEEGMDRFNKIINFLGTADRFHGIWPHWLDGETGKVKPFSAKDDGGDLVESAFLAQGLLTVRQYLNLNFPDQNELLNKIQTLWEEMEWSWYQNQSKDALLWHWSPNFGFEINHALRGYDETMIAYILTVASPTFSIEPNLYHSGWARNGDIKSNQHPYGHLLELKHNGAKELGGPLFWAHYSFLGLDPRGLKDQYADYWQHHVNHSLANRAWCIDNPLGYKGYGENSWGLTASYSIDFYAAHAPGKESDKGVISPTAALSSFPYTPEYSFQAMDFWLTEFGEKLFGPYGFYDAFSETYDWFPQKYLAIDQGPIVVMIENYRTGLLWELFMSSPEIQNALKNLGFESPYLK